jgi:hypothetical protein
VRTLTAALLLLLLASAVATPRAARAQDGVGALLAEARAQLERFQTDSASALLERALAREAGATPAQQVRANVLYGIAQLSRGNPTTARRAFRLALQLSPTERVDSLEFLEPDNLLREFNAERQAVGPITALAEPVAPAVLLPPLTVQVDVPADTELAPRVHRLPVLPRPSRPATVTATIGPSNAPTVVLWGDTLRVGASAALGWDLHDRQGNVVPSGRYALRVTAMDSVGEVSPTIERVLVVSRNEADTQPQPPPLAPSTFEPETRLLKRASPAVLLVGAGLAAAAALLPEVLARTELTEGRDRDGTQLVIAGSVTLAGIVGFLAGHHEQLIPEAARRNADLRQRDAASRQAITNTNAETRANAPVRVRLEAGGP